MLRSNSGRQRLFMQLVLLAWSSSNGALGQSFSSISINIGSPTTAAPSESPSVSARPSMSQAPSQSMEPSTAPSVSLQPTTSSSPTVVEETTPEPPRATNSSISTETSTSTSSTSISINVGMPAEDNPITPAPTDSPTDPPTDSPTDPPTPEPTPPPTESPTASISEEDASTGSNIVVGVYYYPWTRHKFVVQNPPEGYLRYSLQPQQMPVLGNYDDTNPFVISQHMDWSRQANINVWFTSWWGPGSRTDDTLQGTVLPVLSQQPPDVAQIQMAILYETKEWYEDVEPDDIGNRDRSFGRIEDDFRYLCDNYMQHPSYYRIDGKPVVYVYLTRSLHNRCGLAPAVEYMRRGCDNLYIIGDHMWGDAPSEANGLDLLDAIANYDIYGNLDKPTYAGPDKVREYGVWSRNWKEHAAQFNTAFVPGVTPGYNDRGHRLERRDHPPMSRRLTPDLPEGSLFEALLMEAIPLADPKAGNLILVNSWNEWHEDTQIEPVNGESGFTREPTLLTGDLEYRGYGTLYLDMLAKYTTDQALQETLIVAARNAKPLNKYWLRPTTRQGDDEEEEEEWQPDWC